MNTVGIIDIDRLVAHVLSDPIANQQTWQTALQSGLKQQGLEIRGNEVKYIEPLFKYGYLISNGTETRVVVQVESTRYLVKPDNSDFYSNTTALPIGEQDQWHRVWRKPKFKVGDIVQRKGMPHITNTILEIDEENERYKIGKDFYLRFDGHDMWELQNDKPNNKNN